MIFIRYEDWRSYLRYYPVTVLILLANLILFIVTVLDGGANEVDTLLKLGAMINVEPYDREWWRLFAAMFLHWDFNHLFSNSVAILIFAPPLERILGHVRYLLLYVVSGIAGNLISQAIHSQSLKIYMAAGASVAVYGIYGAYLYIALFQRQLMDESSRKTLYILLVVGILFSFAVPHIDWRGHLGGLIGGFFIYGLIVRLLKRR